ncbi:NAD-dependent epimerase/dehydratase family protein [Mesorhizobium sp. CU2]|uniref:NAD-dependent epimerase/dehydratase family protein n=1 Tax=unclassified Mesorhizobium TaxID=325217 RepID=UPI00112B4908|nr:MULTISPECIES: NAD-dependent epimerase/dehydratase family protein [unclassified Mesorhizobium]TPN83171.1 NAD-dependent epimerase/dehydratase family protein [Mesorhizobium sp. CU3]TPO20683.1 NAD-dependent epimerase/dehydratase family protein [Mesorhizobium sp. CU2]
MKVLVTGATGFVGGRIASHLQAAGMDVRVASRQLLPAAPDAVLLPAVDAPDEAFAALMRDATHVVHCAALNNDRHAGEADYQSANAALTGRLAKAAAAHASGRFVYLSSIRAVVGAGFNGTIDEATPPAPQCAYGRSKREGEIRMAEAYAGRADATALRLPAVYGEGMKGSMASLMRLADTALPLPSGALTGMRSLISAEAVAGAVTHILTMPAQLHPIYVASDTPAVALSEIVIAFRRGLGRPARLLPMSPYPLRLGASLLGKGASWRALTASQVCDPSLLASQGWAPEVDTLGRLEELARKMRRQPR